MPSIILIRHGETDYVGKRLAGHLPGIHLNQHGVLQAEQLAARLSALPITALYSSPIDRAIDTAAPLARVRGLKINILTPLTEINVGDWQGKSIPYLRRLKRWRETHEQPARFSFPNGESFVDKQKVMCETLMQLVANADSNDVIACVSHADPIKLCLAYFLDMDLNNFQRIAIDPASASFLYFAGSQIRVGPINLVEEITANRTIR
ncbi:MAG: histidine phosphatase family protein [Anaerolineaceae bacterium]|nr:histidine phosphatase family protein [Anaerolineaceae bacterium]MBN2677300.1 histidine phosphatase family protein [Anaerolineaceae bacterium]